MKIQDNDIEIFQKAIIEITRYKEVNAKAQYLLLNAPKFLRCLETSTQPPKRYQDLSIREYRLLVYQQVGIFLEQFFSWETVEFARIDGDDFEKFM